MGICGIIKGNFINYSILTMTELTQDSKRNAPHNSKPEGNLETIVPDSLLPKLKQLESQWQTVRNRYRNTAGELKLIKDKPKVDVSQVNQLKIQLAEAKNSERYAKDKIEKLTAEHNMLETDYGQLQTEHNVLNQEFEQLKSANRRLVDEVDALKSANQKLQDKNRSALEHTKVVLERLTKIDNNLQA